MKKFRALCALSLGIGLILFAPLSLAGGHAEAASASGVMASTAVVMPSLRQSPLVTTTFDSEGKLWAVWVSGQHLYVNYSEDLGRSFSEPVKVNPQAEMISSNSESRPQIVVSQTGHVYVSYAQKLEKRFSGHVRFSRSVDGGKHFSSPLTVNDNLEMIGHSFPVMAVNKKGHVYIAWLDSRDKVADLRLGANGEGFIGSSVYYALSENEGVSFQPNVRLQANSCQCCRLSIAMDDQGLPAVLWRHIYGTDTRDHALIKFVAKSAFNAPLRASDDNWQVDACPHHGPSLSIDAQENYHLVWFTQGEERKGSFYAYSSDGGQHFSSPVALGSPEQPAQHPYVHAVGKSVYIVWTSFDGVKTQLYGMTSEDRGKHWGQAYVIASTANASDYPFLLSKEGAVYVSWQTVEEGLRLLSVKADAPLARMSQRASSLELESPFALDHSLAGGVSDRQEGRAL